MSEHLNVPQCRDGFAESPVGHWVGCLWNFDSGDGSPHPEDANVIKQLCRNGVTTKCIATDGDYFVLRYNAQDLRVRPFSIRIMPFAPKYVHGEQVRTILGPDVQTLLESTVREIGWHVKRGEYTYRLVGNSRRRMRIYFEGQLEITT